MLNFLGIGAQKAGTTWLFEQLNHHPKLAFPLGKEAHFWDHPHNETDIANYLDCFSRVNAIAGEITPAYSIMPVEKIREIYRYTPHLRLIYIIRNPIDRAWSSALMALQRSEMIIDEASDQWFIDHFHSSSSRRRGDYQACIKNWHSVFPYEQLLVLLFDQIINEPEKLLNHCFEYLGVESIPPRKLQEWGCRVPIFAGLGHSLRPTLKPILQLLYHKQIEQLAEYLNIDLGVWLTPPDVSTTTV